MTAPSLVELLTEGTILMKLALTAYLPSLLLCGTAFAQAPHGILDLADANKDGEVTRAEYLANGVARFARMDVNHDDRLTIEERMPERAPNGLPPLTRDAPRRPGDVDADGDGFVSRAEFFFNLGRLYSRFDANGDDKVAGDEIMPASAGPVPRH